MVEGLKTAIAGSVEEDEPPPSHVLLLSAVEETASSPNLPSPQRLRQGICQTFKVCIPQLLADLCRTINFRRVGTAAVQENICRSWARPL